MTAFKDEILSHLNGIGHLGVKPGLERIRAAFKALGRPEEKLKVVHVAGTNGKGSVCSLVAQMLARSGHSVGLSLSPHVLDWRERAQFCPRGGEAPERPSWEDLARTHRRLLAALPKDLELTYFEWSLALAVAFFAERDADFVVLETGMGGRWDATNACPSLVAGVTTVGLDHVAELGGTLPQILSEKQRIAKPGGDFLFGPRDPALVAQAREHCREIGARFRHADDFAAVLREKNPLGHPFLKDKPATFGENLIFACGIGLILEEQGVAVDWDGFLGAPVLRYPPARFEKIGDSPTVILDGAHNEPALKALKAHVDGLWGGRYDLVFGCLKDRDFASLAGIGKSRDGLNFWAVFDAAGRESPPEAYAEAIHRHGGEMVKLNGALRRRLGSEGRPVLVCGSLYLCGRFAAFWR